jgi:RNA polymerase sigma-70 factor (ECF subfamily)
MIVADGESSPQHTPGTVQQTFEDDALRCLDDVARFARSLSHAPDDADDLVQETYLRAFRSRHTWKDGSDMRRWLFTICKNVFLRSNERAKDQVSLDDDPTDETLAAVRYHNTLVASGEHRLFDSLSMADAIQVALATLAEPFRLAVVLVDMEGYGYEDAAAVLGVPVGTVRSRLFRARRLLQEQLVAHARDAGFAATRAPSSLKTST